MQEKSMTDFNQLSTIFRRFAEIECHGSSELYERLSLSVSEDPELLELAANARVGQPVPNLFFAAVHSLLLSGEKHRLSRFYTSISDDANVVDDSYPDFRDFCLTHRDSVSELLQTKLVQTNVVERCSSLLPAFGSVAERAGEFPMSLIEVGTSAGLNLFWDKYSYNYGNGLTSGNPDAPVRLQSQLKGNLIPQVPKAFPEIVSRVGLDLNTIDVNDDNAVGWLRALVWPEHKKRVENLYGAIQVVRQNPPDMIEGDALQTLPDALAHTPQDSTICLFHSHTLNQFTPDARQEFYELIAEASNQRDIYVISIEGVSGSGSALELRVFRQGELSDRTHIGNCDAHGRWLEWLI
jgi:hypothetical protein